MKKITAPLDEKTIKSLCAGDEVSLSGVIYTARDQAHLRMVGMIDDGAQLPIEIKGQVVYYCGPTPAGDRVIGACGPTTSGRMDKFTPAMLKAGMKGMIGKGTRSEQVIKEMKKSCAVYFAAPGGAGAYLSGKVRACEVVAFEDLGPEAVYRLEVEDFPLVVAVDCKGRSIYDRIRGQ